ncbi:hypothetical protein QZH44_08500 [Pseudomonas corrugata]|uniref:DUF7706 family protein n=1 Tax=Pseudomonas corrugata TaxID=47879 RepID=UPI003D816E7D
MNETFQTNDQNTLMITTPAGAIETEVLTKAETWALAHFVGRVGWPDFSAHATDTNEAFLIKQAFDKLQNVLERSGFASR